MASVGTLRLQWESHLFFLPNTASTGFHEQLKPILSSKVPSKSSLSGGASSPATSGRCLRRARERPTSMLLAVAASSSADIDLIKEEDAPAQTADMASLKIDLLAMVAGLDRGLSASESDVLRVNCVAGQLEAAGGPVMLVEGEEDLQGRWRLIYSSAFASGSLGGRRPGPPKGRLPLTLGQVYQRIDVLAMELDNVVDLCIGTPWPLPPLEATATLAHTFQLIGNNMIKITLERTSAKFGGGLSQLPPYELPQLPDFLRPNSPSLRSGSFEITYLDKSMRISRGDRGELRMFVLA